MRWLLIDEFTEISKGKIARAVKLVTRSEKSLTHVYPAFPVMSPCLMLEMMAQVGGVLAGATIDFSKEVVLAKISDAEFYSRVMPSSILRIEGRLIDINEQAANTECVITSGGKPAAKASIFFGLFDKLDENSDKVIVFSEDFMETFAIKNILMKTG
jgi:3-hydroxymyristoyl/3-hydroxydecanoyl-(acyl carrier protein) dehydratase